MKFSSLLIRATPLGAYRARPWTVMLLAVAAVTATAETAVECAAIEDRETRLECFDRAFPNAPEAAAEPEAGGDPADVQRSADADPAASDVAVPTKVPTKKAPGEKSRRPLFGDEKINLTSTIKSIHGREKQAMVFLLANDEIWMQTTPRPLPFKEGDTVTVKNGFLGGYFMRTERGLSTRVKRIRR